MGMITTPALGEILQLSVPERIQLVEDIWDSVVAMPESLVLSEPQRQVLDERLKAYRRNPDVRIAWDEIKRKLRDAT